MLWNWSLVGTLCVNVSCIVSKRKLHYLLYYTDGVSRLIDVGGKGIVKWVGRIIAAVR